jgi:hypothetical protein
MRAMSWMVLALDGVPFTKNLPSSYSMSSTAASRRWAATIFDFSLILPMAPIRAPPPTAVVRLP